MLFWILGRLSQALLVVIAMTVMVFIGVSVIGNPVDILISPDADAAERARMIAQYGLEKPILQQYGDFVSQLLKGNLGISYIYNQPALQLILGRLPATLELALAALLIAVGVGLPLGFVAGLYPDSLVAKLLMSFSVVGLSVPTFWLALILIMFFSVQLGVFPAGGRGQTRELFGIEWSFLTADGLRHLMLPALNLAVFKVALILRLTRAGIQEVIPQDYVRYARARGLREKRVIGVHVMRNILIPVVTIVGLEFGSVIAFSVVTENIFAWPGMGKLIIESINMLDRPVVVAYLMVIAVVFVVINLLVDLAYTLLDPRVRLQGGRK